MYDSVTSLWDFSLVPLKKLSLDYYISQLSDSIKYILDQFVPALPWKLCI